MKTELTNDELQLLLEEQIEFLECSASSYDNGFTGEIKRLAVSVRVLVHDTNKSKSLLTLLNIKYKGFVDTSIPFDENNLLSHSSLVLIGMTKTGSVPLPLLDECPWKRTISFDSWWSGIVFVDKDRNEFSRKDVVLSLANKEGGAHVEEKLDKKYADLRKNNSLGWFDVTDDGIKIPSADEVPATMRQIAHELLKTIKENYNCKRDEKENHKYEVFFMGASVVQGSTVPPILDHNLPKSRPIVNGNKIGRNDPCTCGSGKKYKICCIN
jgi:hypothetical protein